MRTNLTVAVAAFMIVSAGLAGADTTWYATRQTAVRVAPVDDGATVCTLGSNSRVVRTEIRGAWWRILTPVAGWVAGDAFSATAGSGGGTGPRLTRVTVNLRSGPGTNFSILRQIPRDIRVAVDARVLENGGWAHIRSPYAGWILGTYLKMPLRVSADFPGGNILVDGIQGDVVSLRQDLRDTPGHWFYWCFRIVGAEGRTLTFQFTDGNVIGVRGPALSLDGGRSWAWLGAASVENVSFRYAFPANAGEVRFAAVIPYLASDLRTFLARHAGRTDLRVETLGTSRQGRAVELLRAGRLDGACTHRVLLTARHHACETSASYVLEGILDAVLGPGETGAWLRDRVEFAVVPFMDKDGVENGDQGKNRSPHDHNRDYIQDLYPEVRAMKAFAPAWSAGRLRIALDLHSPGLRGERSNVIHFVGGPEPANWERVRQFAGILESVRTGPLPYRTSDNLPFGQSWNTALAPGLQNFARWAIAEVPGVRAAVSLETPYADVSGWALTPAMARRFGADIALAIQQALAMEALGR